MSTYNEWRLFLRNFPKDTRYTLGAKVDVLFLEVAEALFVASRVERAYKLPFLRKASLKLDLLRFFLQVAWESKSLDTKKYIRMSEHFDEIGRMLGGWQKQTLQKETPASRGGKT
ncbi:MAG: four helix bundle protein [bacterium]|nr:four helix bundle protein [bacterium]